MKKSLVALAFGTLALGITEYVMMGILADVASSLNVSITKAGHLISAYALGVTSGAPLLTVAHKYGPKNILLVLAGVMLCGAVISSLAPDYYTLLVARFISGLPHGAYFGVASIVAVRLADEKHQNSAMSVMVAGMTVANLLGVPLGTALSSGISWRVPFVFVIAVSIAVLYYIWKWVPDIEPLPDHGYKRQFGFLKSGAPWLIIIATMLGNGGIFCWYSYISPILTDEGGFTEAMLPMLMIAAGGGMVIGNILCGRLSDKYSPGRVAGYTQGLAAVVLLAIFFLSRFGWVSAALMVVCTACLFGASVPQQFLILKHAPGGEMLGGASIQMAFNLGNAFGAFCGGLPIDAGLPVNYAALAGVPFAFAGSCLLMIFCKRYEQRQ